MSGMFSGGGGNFMSAAMGMAPMLIAQHKQAQQQQSTPGAQPAPVQADTPVLAAAKRRAMLGRRSMSTIMTDAAGDGQKLGG
jgi:hypothetical protein